MFNSYRLMRPQPSVTVRRIASLNTELAAP